MFLLLNLGRFLDLIKYALKAKQAKQRADDTQNMYFVAVILEDAELLQINQFDCFMESAPQLLLNLYIMIKDESQFDGMAYVLYGLRLKWLYHYKNSFLFSYIGDWFRFLRHQFGVGNSLFWKKICLMKGIKRGGEQNRSNDIINFQTDDAIDCIKNTNLKKCALLFFAHLIWIGNNQSKHLFSFPQLEIDLQFVLFGVI